MPVDKFANMEEKLWILEDLNMMYIRQIALSLQVKVDFHLQLLLSFLLSSALICAAVTSCVTGRQCVHVYDWAVSDCLLLFF